MRKKHFAGVLMLTAAVALGTVSPVVLPNTAIEVKAAETYDFGTTDATKYATPTTEVTAEGKLKVKKSEFTATITSDNDKKHIFGFGTDKSKAIEDAIQHKEDASRVITITNDAFEVAVPEDASVLAIVKVGSITGGSKEVTGGQVALSGIRNSIAENTDYTTTGVTEGKVKAVTALKYRVKDAADKKWKDATASSEFPASPVEAGKTVSFEVKKSFVAGATSSTGRLDSEIKTVDVTKKLPFTREADLSKLKFTFDDDTLKATNFAEIIKNETTRAAITTVKFKKNSENEQNFTADGVQGLTANATVKIYAKDEGENTALTFNFKKIEKPVITQVDGKYQLKLSKVEKDVKYKISKNNNNFDEVKVAADGTIAIDHAGAATESYYIKAFASGTAVEVKDNVANIKLASDTSEKVDVPVNQKLMSKTRFDKIAVALDAEKKNLTVKGDNTLDGLDEAEKATYEYGSFKGKVDKDTDVKTPLVAGTFMLKSGNFSKTITFVEPINKKSFENGAQLLAALGGKDKLGEFIVKDSKGTDVKEADYAKLVSGDYTVKFKNPSDALTAKAEQTYKLSTEVKVTIRKVSYTSPVVPSTTPTPEPKKDEPKKNEPKKEEPKKNEPKKEEPKKDDTKKDDSKDMASSTDDTKPAPAKKATAKTAKVSVKVTSKEVTNKLQTSGTKLVAKNVYKVTVKNASKAVSTSIKVNLGKKAKTVYVLDLKTGKTIKASYKKGKVTFKTKNSIAKFVIVNKAAKAKKK